MPSNENIAVPKNKGSLLTPANKGNDFGFCRHLAKYCSVIVRPTKHNTLAIIDRYANFSKLLMNDRIITGKANAEIIILTSIFFSVTFEI